MGFAEQFLKGFGEDERGSGFEAQRLDQAEHDLVSLSVGLQGPHDITEAERRLLEDGGFWDRVESSLGEPTKPLTRAKGSESDS
ncbi:MAG: hypothetical protein HYU28_07130 [Actinobacteria bacterium]|nr:hypothetical protein [Actinomycetota bacterium]